MCKDVELNCVCVWSYCQPEELIDTRIIEADPVEIRNDGIIRRLLQTALKLPTAPTVEVDLTLGPNEAYEAPYPRAIMRLVVNTSAWRT
ncbi:hypothetical protein CCP2SC5_1390003 [Azospirillaceae bacterium]